MMHRLLPAKSTNATCGFLNETSQYLFSLALSACLLLLSNDSSAQIYQTGTLVFRDGQTKNAQLAYRSATQTLRVRQNAAIVTYKPADLTGFSIGKNYYRSMLVGVDRQKAVFLPCLVAGQLSLYKYSGDNLYLLSMGDSTLIVSGTTNPISIFQFTHWERPALDRVQQKPLVAYVAEYNRTQALDRQSVIYEEEQSVSFEVGLRLGLQMGQIVLTGQTLSTRSSSEVVTAVGFSTGFSGKSRLGYRLDFLAERRRGSWATASNLNFQDFPLSSVDLSFLSLNALLTYRLVKQPKATQPYVLLGGALLKVTDGTIFRTGYRTSLPVSGSPDYNQIGMVVGFGASRQLTSKLRLATEAQLNLAQAFSKNGEINSAMPMAVNTQALGVHLGVFYRPQF